MIRSSNDVYSLGSASPLPRANYTTYRIGESDSSLPRVRYESLRISEQRLPYDNNEGKTIKLV